MMARDDAQPGPFSLADMLRRPIQFASPSPCQTSCVVGANVREWIAVIAQSEKLGLNREEAFERAWRIIVEVNPFPATTGRICPAPCEVSCSRVPKDGGVAVHAMERFLGDWALERGLRLRHLGAERFPESIGVIGAGPAGLSFAYQMARRGYPVTVHERESRPGGMLLRGIPAYRLPDGVLMAEIDRIIDLGVQIRLGSRAGVDIPLSQLREIHDALFLGIGAQVPRRLGIPGEEGPGCLSGIDYLRRFREGHAPELGRTVAVVGGGNTAVDVARAARRAGCEVKLLYRRTREAMPAIPAEVDAALEEGVALMELVVPLAVLREAGRVRGVRLVRARLAEVDASMRRRSEPIPESEHVLRVDAVIAAVSQEPDWEGLEALHPGRGRMLADRLGAVADDVWAGGDARGLGIAGMAIFQGRRAAEAVHARLRGLSPPAMSEAVPPAPPRVRLALYETRRRAEVSVLRPAQRLSQPEAEVVGTLDDDMTFGEASRCLSCGSCFGCQRCWMYCQPGGYTPLDEVAPGAYFALDLARCEGCGKCIELCPCGFLALR